MAPQDGKALEETLVSSLALLSRFTTSLNPATASPTADPIDNAPNPLHILRDSAKLLKAQATKISLLSINKPFSPSAVQRIVKDVSGTCLPAMMSAVQICDQSKAIWSTMMSREAHLRVRRILKDIETLLEEVRSVAQGNEPRKRDSLNSTGVVWESCDALIELEQLGIAGLAVEKAQQWRDTIKDAIEELREWKEGEDLDSEGQDELLESDDEGVDGDRDSIEDIFNAANSMPKDRPELESVVEDADGRLKKIVLLYNAVIKRRLKTYKSCPGEAESTSNNIDRLDKAMERLRRLPHQVDELASCLYDLDEVRAIAQLKKCVAEASHVAERLFPSWDAREDEFTTWSVKWKEAIRG
ncbi:Grap2 and cyclin-D-interacting [Teratosphaeria destructans]|uniref:Grap2 and cyclin-D-interacting n=1 Tax=Teratosphaeria destructans TaxID=418781 RepID=A0A9W7VZC9_9PEZI|nr:Grap2 and cyclin-D-interacting [Teratosphaeria destructans]